MKELKETLEFDKLLEEVSKFSRSEAGRKECLALSPLKGMEQIITEFTRLREVMEVVDDLPVFPALESVPVFLAKDVIQPPDLFHILKMLRFSGELLGFIKRTGKLTFLKPSIFPLEDIQKELEQSIDDDGEIREDATPMLETLHKEKRRTEGKIQEVMERFLEEQGDAIQDRIITQRMGRKVIPVKKTFASGINGVVVDISRSGETVFVEPMEAVFLNNKLTEVLVEIEREKHRLLLRLTGILKSNRDYVLSTFKTLAYLDTLIARVMYLQRFNAVMPDISTEEPFFHLKGVKHPLLILRRDTVPQDIFIGRECRTMVVSGPNAGGKTVLLKTIGISILAVFHGIPIIAREGTVIGNIGRIFAVIEDEQSIEEGLSTFTSHVMRLKDVLEEAQKGDVVLIDEIGGGTDPEEGSALAIAVLEDLHQRGCLTVATTHLSRLKFFVHEREGMLNAAMEFRDGPTYRLVPGIPGVSMALDIARRSGLPESVIEKAEGFIHKGELETDKLLKEYQDRLSRLREREKELEIKKKEVLSMRDEYERKVKNVKKESKEILRKAKEEAEEIVLKARSVVERTIREIKESQASKEAIKRYKKSFEELLKEFSRPEEEGIEEETKIEHQPVITPVSEIGEMEKLEIDVRGLFREDAVEQVDRFLDRAYMHGISKVRIIHGKGSGVLRTAIRGFLARDKRVKSYYSAPPEEGNDGVTVVELE